MAGHIQNVLRMYPLGISRSHSGVHLKCTQHLITGHIGVTCCLCSQCVHNVPSGYLGPCPQCKQVVNLTVEDLSEDEGDQDKDVNPADKDSEFNLDDKVDLGSPLLDGMLSDRQPTPDQENIAASTATATRLETRNHEPTEDDWENL